MEDEELTWADFLPTLAEILPYVGTMSAEDTKDFSLLPKEASKKKLRGTSSRSKFPQTEGVMNTTNNESGRPVKLWTTTEKLTLLVIFLRLVHLLGLKTKQGHLADLVQKQFGIPSTDRVEFKKFKDEYTKFGGLIDSSAGELAIRLLRGLAENIEQIKKFWLVDFRSEQGQGRADFEESFLELGPTELARVRLDLRFPPRDAFAPELLAVLDSIPGVHLIYQSTPANPAPPDAAARAVSLVEIEIPTEAGSDPEPPPAAGEDSGSFAVVADTSNPPVAPVDKLPKPAAPAAVFPKLSALPLPDPESDPEPQSLDELLAQAPPAPKPPPKPAEAPKRLVLPIPAPVKAKPKGPSPMKNGKSRILFILAMTVLIFSLSAAGVLYFKKKPEVPPSEKDTTINTPQGEKGKVTPDSVGEQKNVAPSPPEKVSMPKRPQGLTVDKRNFKNAIAEVLGDQWFKETLPNPKDLTWTQAHAFAGDKLPAAWSTTAHEQVGAEEDFNSFIAFICFLGVEVDGEYRPTNKQVWTWMLLRRLTIYRAGEGAPFKDADLFDVGEVKSVREKALNKRSFSLATNTPETLDSLRSAREKFKQLVMAYRKRALED